MPEAFSHAQTRARELIRLSGRDTPSVTDQLGFSYKLSDTPPLEASAAPALGAHTVELLNEIGVDNEQIKRLNEMGVIGIGGASL
jgi:crotonobetainyl-CoA:carnitine CoA-transferase CaiB-like acyl-CoA transferase